MPNNKLFNGLLLVDTGDPEEAREVQQLLQQAGHGSLDGATTNPSYFAKNPKVQERIKQGEKFTTEELLNSYREAVTQLAEIIPGGDISVEVYADQDTKAEKMAEQAREMSSWIPTARIKLPITTEGLKAAATLKDEIRLNMTLCFSQQQAAAVYEATKDPKEPVFISPFIGRFEDRGENGCQLVRNIVDMYKPTDHHVKVLAASFRSAENVLEMINIGVDVMTINLERFKLWSEEGWQLPDENYNYQFEGEDIPYKKEVPFGKNWQEYDIQHDLTDNGLKRFVDDWNNLLG